MTLLLRRAQGLGIRDIVRNAQAQERTDTGNAGTLTHEGVGTPEAHYHTDKPAHWKKRGKHQNPMIDRRHATGVREHWDTGERGHGAYATHETTNTKDLGT